MITKRFGVDFVSADGALTLDVSEVYDAGSEDGLHSKTHDSGWTITGEIREDHFRWVSDFKASHPEFGTVAGNFEGEVTADSEEGFAHFWANHQPLAWDYGDL